MLALALAMTVKDTAEIVITCDDAVVKAWPDEGARARYPYTGEAPGPIPRDATVIKVRPMGWAERKSARDATFSGRYSVRGGELATTYRVEMIKSEAGADEWRRSLSMEDRRELDQHALLQLESDEAVAAACVVEVRQGARVLSWVQLLECLTDGTTASTVIRQVARHVSRISTLGTEAAF